MPTFKKKDLNELVGGDYSSGGGDRNVTNNSEIETGPVQKPYNDDSDYEKGESPTTDVVANRYRQNIPWFAVYSYGGTNYSRGVRVSETKNTIIKKKQVEEKIEDLVKKSKDNDFTDKNNNTKLSKIVNLINNNDFTDKELEDLKNLLAKKNPNNPYFE